MEQQIAFSRKISGIALAVLWLLVLLGLQTSTSASAQSRDRIVQLQTDPGYYQSATEYLDYLIDSSRRLKVSDLIEDPSNLKPVTTAFPDFGLTEARVWLRLAVHNPHKTAGTWRLDLKRQYSEEVKVYAVRAGQAPRLLVSHGQSEPYSKRRIPNRYLEVDFSIAGGETVQFLITHRSTSTTYLPVAVAKPDGVYTVHANEARIDWLLNGALFAMILFALLLTPITGWRLSISFSLYVTAGLFYIANADGYTFQLLWPNNPGLNDPMNLAAMLLMPATGLLFARQLFIFRESSPAFDKLLLVVISVFLVAAVLAFALVRYDWFMVPAYSMIPLAKIVQVAAGIIALRGKKVGAIPYFIGAMLIVSSISYATVAHLMPGHFDLDNTLDFGHFILFLDCLAFAVAMMLRLVAIQKERDLAMQSELRLSKEKVALGEDLIKTQRDYHDARVLSEQRLNQLSSVSHDIRQPLVSLRTALGRFRGQNEQVTEQMHAAFDYLENLAIDQMGDSQPDDNEEHGGRSHIERFPVNVVLDNVFEIFRDEARANKLDFRYRPAKTEIETDPVALMRAVSNLVSNAVKHTQKGSILLAARARGNKLRIEVWDTGPGMDQDQIGQMMARHQKGDDSDGAGLGLSIVQEICASLDLQFEFRSSKGKGSAAFIHVPVRK